MADLDKEEKDLLDSYERDEWQSVADQESEVNRYREYARATIEKHRQTVRAEFGDFLDLTDTIKFSSSKGTTRLCLK